MVLGTKKVEAVEGFVELEGAAEVKLSLLVLLLPISVSLMPLHLSSYSCHEVIYWQFEQFLGLLVHKFPLHALQFVQSGISIN